MKLSLVGIAELVTATEALRPRGEAVRAIAKMCGLAIPSSKAEENLKDDRPSRLDREPTSDDDEAGASDAQDFPPTVVPEGVRRLEPAPRSRAPIPTQADPIDSSAAAGPGFEPTRFASLLREKDASDVLTCAASSSMPSEEIDIEKVVDSLARAEVLTSYPRVHRPSLSLGAQVLVDISESMQPFFLDQQELLQRLQTILGDSAAIEYFAGDPIVGIGPQRQRSKWRRYRPPLPGTPVITLSDLGCGFPRNPGATSTWLDLARRLRKRGSRLITLAPVNARRVPLSLRQASAVVVWDRNEGRRAAARLLRDLNV